MPKYGSPPPARGAPLPGCRPSHSWWITPACAGSTLCRGPRCPHAPDPPRLRGEHRCSSWTTGSIWGSPPPARGAPSDAGRPEPGPGITPDCAGSTGTSSTATCRNTDHPRLRGEHLFQAVGQVTHGGSPPPARGARCVVDLDAHMHRITPACAGSTAAALGLQGRSADHPRLRGEHRRMPVDPSPVQGSPPTARGALALQARRHAEIRITPACAGSTSSRLSAKSLMVDHPRLRGEHAVSWTSMPTCTGSPPPARGAPLQLLDYRVDLRITPACAGSTVGCR